MQSYGGIFPCRNRKHLCMFLEKINSKLHLPYSKFTLAINNFKHLTSSNWLSYLQLQHIFFLDLSKRSSKIFMKQFIFVFQTWYYLLGFTLEGFKQQETQYSYELQHCKSTLQPLDYVMKTYVRLCRVTSFDGVLHINIIW